MKIRRFQVDDFVTYQGWYVDPELNRQLGPMDQEWLDYVLSDTTGIQFALTANGELVAVAGIKCPVDMHHYYFITDIAVRPDLRRTGVGRKVLTLLLAHPDLKAVAEWRTGVMPSNPAALFFLERAGWRQLADTDPGSALIDFIYQNPEA